jgi:uncharacterized protein
MTSQPLPRLVIDTNIFIPGVVGASATPPRLTASAALLRAWRAGFCSVIVSEALLDEYMEVLQRPAFGVERRRAMRLRAQISDRAIEVNVRASRPLLRVDPDDDMVLKTAIAGKAELLVTDNRNHFAEIAALRGGTAELRYRGVHVVGLSHCLGHDPSTTRERGSHHAPFASVALKCGHLCIASTRPLHTLMLRPSLPWTSRNSMEGCARWSIVRDKHT